MPHKRNPVAAVAVVAAAARAPGLVSTMLSAMAHEHERAAGLWHAEWRPLNDLLRTTGSAAAWLRDSLTHLRVDAARVRANIDLTAGLAQAERVTTALTGDMGRLAAHDLVAEASARALDEGRALEDVLAEVPDVTRHLSRDQLKRLLDPASATGSAERLVDRALAHHAASSSQAMRNGEDAR
jgi:3-carboxy-cis,cis-muconate cycloisomerase